MLIMIKSAKAARRPLAGFGMGAYFCDGIRAGSAVGVAVPGMGAAKGIEMAAALALPRVKSAVAGISEGYAPAAASGLGYQVGIQAKPEQSTARKFQAQHFEHVTRVNPALLGGVGPHPAREPDPV